MKQMKRILSLLLSLCLVLGLIPGTAFAAGGNLPFTDVDTTDWCYDAVQYVYEKGMMNGTSTTTFSPDGTTTRGMIVTILHRMEGTPAATGTAFTDVPTGQWYSDAVSWASANGIVGGYGNGLFGPSDPITREQMAAILNRYSTYKGYDTGTVGSITGFSDASQVSTYAAEPMGWAIGNGLIAGVGNNTLAPKGNATRAQVATILKRFCENIADKANTAPETPVDKTYTVTFDLNYGSNTQYDTKTVKEGETVSKPSNPSRSGYSFNGWYAEKSGGRQFDFKTGITSDLTLYAHWSSNSSSSGGGGSSGDGGGGYVPPSTTCHTVSFELLYDEIVENAELFGKQAIAHGSKIAIPVNPQPILGHFDGWYTSAVYDTPFDINQPVTDDITLYAKWNIDSLDSDGDGLYDEVELYRGLDPNNPDTDGDGLSDYIEIEIDTNPLLVDSNGNGVSDYDEDADGDGLSNGYEVSVGTSPVLPDTDGDGLSDYDEIYKYGTTPALADTDADNAIDGWEVENVFDPLAYNSSFSITIQPEKPTETSPVTAGVDVSVRGFAPDSVKVKAVGTADNSMISSGIAGYLGQAYEFEADGKIDSATLSFQYDPSLGVIGENFQPRIYYFDEENGILEELADQIVIDGQVSVQVSHFSTYLLLNKVEFDAIWEADIKPPFSDGEVDENATLDIAFVIDYSASMDDNDPDQLCKQLAKEFVAKLREGKDQAAVIKFIRRASVISGLTTNKEDLNDAIESIEYDDGYGTYSGTDGSAGLKTALDVLAASDSEYQYVIFITDGEDNGYSFSYDDLIEIACDYGVTVYTVGMGTAAEAILMNIASQTGGKYYHATASVDTDDLINLDEVFKDIESETVDLTTDSNHDGISDYYTQLIYEGKLVLSNGSNEFEGQNFNYDANGNLSADFDGDGLRNGQELIVVRDGDKVYLKKYSDPMMKHSDSDGIDDYTEYRQGSNPLQADFDGNSVGMLTRTDFLYYNQIVDLYNDDAVFRWEQALFGAGLTDGFESIAKKQIINYFYNYSSDEYFEHQTNKDIAITVANTGNDIIGGLLKYIGYIKKASGIYGTMSEAEAFEEIRKAASTIAEFKAAGSDFYEAATYEAEWFEQGVAIARAELFEKHYIKAIEDVMELDTGHEILGNIYLKINDFNDKYKAFMDKKVISDLSVGDTIKLVKWGTDVADEITTLAKVNAATELFERNMDILIEIRDHAEYDKVSKAARTVLNAMGQGTSSYYEELAKAIARTTSETLIDEIKGKVLDENPIYKGYKLAMSILKIVGADKTVKSVYSILCYSDMIDSVDTLCLNGLEQVHNSHGYYYYVPTNSDGTDSIRYLTHAAQLCMLAEKVYVDLPQSDSYHEELARDNMDGTKKWAEKLSLPLSENLLKELGY